MIQLTEDEVKGFNIISIQAQNIQVELQKTLGAQKALLALLEKKYKAKFNPETGQLEPKKK